MERLESVEEQTVVVLDEVDKLQDPEVLYDLYHVPGLTLVHVANRGVELFADLPDRITSRLRIGYRVAFPPYTVDQLVSILEARVRAGLAPGVIDARRLDRIAREADGDARVAIAVLRMAAQMATTGNADRITDEVLDDAVPKAHDRPDGLPVGSLDGHRQVLLDVLREAPDGLQPKRLYAAYAKRRIGDTRSRRTVQKYLNELIRLGLVLEEGASQARRYRAASGLGSQGRKSPQRPR